MSKNKLTETAPHFDTDIVSPGEMQELHTQLEKLITHSSDILKEVEAFEEAERILDWIEKCEEGSGKAERKLYHQGLEILEDIKKRLGYAMEEQQRIEEESPTAADNSKGREAERLAKATRQANRAVSTLTDLTDHKKISKDN